MKKNPILLKKVIDKEKSISKDLKTLSRFFDVYCSGNHRDSLKHRFSPRGILAKFCSDSLYLCDHCRQRFLYAAIKRIVCPYNPKPACKKCPSICYSPEHRSFMREMMRFSGKYLIKHGRVDLLFKYFF